jgi:hypothetical protein
MNRCDRTHHREHDDKCGNSAEQPDDESDSTKKFAGDHKKARVDGRCRCLVNLRILLARPGPPYHPSIF